MKLLVLAPVLCLLACGGASPPVTPTITLAAGTASLTATVTNVKTGTGTVYCALFNAAPGFPGASPIIGGSTQGAASASTVSCDFTALPSGDYAISVFEDENADGQLDTSAFGAPTEPYGASNNVLPATSAPTFQASKVTLADGQSLPLTITLK